MMSGNEHHKRPRVVALGGGLADRNDDNHHHHVTLQLPGVVNVSDESSYEASTSASTFKSRQNHNHAEAGGDAEHDSAGDTGSLGEATNDEYGGLSPEEYEFQMGMMNAMEDGFEEDEEDDAAVGGRPIVDNEAVAPAAANDVQQHDAEARAYNDLAMMGMRNDMEHGGRIREADEFDELAMGMMNAMEDGVTEGEQDDDDDDDNDEYEDALEELPRDDVRAQQQQQQQQQPEDPDPIIGTNRDVGVSLASLSNSIVQACSSVPNAVRDYYRMSQSDQAQVFYDMTGYNAKEGKALPASSDEFEPRQMVEEALKQLPEELLRMPSSIPHDALDLALEKDPKYVHSRPFLLKFLRAEKFGVFAAAARMCRHFESKLELFGEEALVREITLDDLNEDDMAALRTGYLQVFQELDRVGRPVILYYKAVSSECYKNRENILRTYWYILYKLSEREDFQKLGVSSVVYNNGGFPRQGMDYEKSRRMSHLFKAIPLRLCNFFVCIDDTPWLTVVETFAVIITRFLRVRLRMLKGTHEEVMEKLESVGIPSRSIPVSDKSELLVEAHLKWIENHREQEEKLKGKG